MKKRLFNLLKKAIVLFIFLCSFLYFFQEKLIFYPQKLNKNHTFNFSQNFQELHFKTTDGKLLNGLLFKSKNTKGLIFYLHGNAGSLNSWGNVAKTFTNFNYDILLVDYRGFGKSEGTIISQKQLFEDNQMIYNQINKEYKEQNIIVLGYSIGTGLAAKLASDNHPKQVILQAPYYSLIDLMHQKVSFIPSFLLKYKFETNKYLKNCKMPITVFHGNQDRVINYNSSLKLKNELKNKITLITLQNQGHNGMTDNVKYKTCLKEILL